MILITCTNCGAKIRGADSAAGKRVKCPKCATIFQVPKPGEDDDKPTATTPEEPDETPAKQRVTAKPTLPGKKSSAVAAKKTILRDPTVDDDETPPPKKKRRDDNDELDEPRSKKKPRAADDDDDDDADDAPPPRRDRLSIRKKDEAEGGGKGLAITGMVLGIVAIVMVIGLGVGGMCLGGVFFCCCPLGPSAAGFTAAGVSAIPALLAVIFGYLGMGGSGRGMAITGLVLGVVTLLLCVILVVVSILLIVGVIGAAAAMPPPPPPNQPMFPQQR